MAKFGKIEAAPDGARVAPRPGPQPVEVELLPIPFVQGGLPAVAQLEVEEVQDRLLGLGAGDAAGEGVAEEEVGLDLVVVDLAQAARGSRSCQPHGPRRAFEHLPGALADHPVAPPTELAPLAPRQEPVHLDLQVRGGDGGEPFLHLVSAHGDAVVEMRSLVRGGFEACSPCPSTWTASRSTSGRARSMIRAAVSPSRPRPARSRSSEYR